jgi:hypothetical protein
MEFISATDLQFNSRPVMEAWLGNNLLWGRGVIWTGSGFDNNWSNASNWYKAKVPPTFSSIQFTGTTRLSTYNDFSIDRPVNDITFNASSGSFQLSGNRFILSTGGITNNSVNAQTINNDIKLSSKETYINCNTGDITFNGLLSGDNSIIKTGNAKANLIIDRSKFTGALSVIDGIFQFNNLSSNGGVDLASISPSSINLYNNSTLNIYANFISGANNRATYTGRTINFNSIGSQTVSITGNILFNNSTFVTNGGPKKYISAPLVPGSNYFNAQFTTITYDIADGIDDVDLEISAAIYFQCPVKKGTGKISIVAPFSTGIAGPLTISAGTFDVGGTCSLPLNFTNNISTIINNGTFSYSSSVNSNCSNYVISGTGNLIKSKTSTLNLSADRCSYIGSTSIINGSIIITKNIATSTFTQTTLTVNFSTPPNIGDTFRFFSGSTIQSYASVSLIGAPARTASYNSTNSTLTIDS